MKRTWASVLLFLFYLPSVPVIAQQVAPGISLPDRGRVFVLDTVDGQKKLVQLKYVNSTLNRHTGSNIAKSSLWVVKLKATV